GITRLFTCCQRFFFFQAEDGIRDRNVTGVQTCALPISEIYGMQVAKNMLPIQHETIDFSISGYICKPEVTRASRSYMSTIVNGRYIKSNALNHAILRGYHTLLTIGRSPIVVLSIDRKSVV